MQASVLPLIKECIVAFNLQLQQYITIGPGMGMLAGQPQGTTPSHVDFWIPIIHPDDAGRVSKEYSSLTPGNTLETTYRILPADGSTLRHIAERRSIYTDALTGHPVLLCTLNEVAAHAPLAGNGNCDALQSEQFLASLADSHTYFLVRLDRTGCFTFANKRYCDVFGYTAHELKGQHFAMNSVSEDRALSQAAVEYCLANPGKIIPLTREKLDKAGKRHPTEWEFVSVVNERGEVSEIRGLGQDTSFRMETEIRVMRANEKLDNFIESITDSFIILDKSWRFIKINGAFLQTFNLTQREVIGKTVWEVFPNIVNLDFAKKLYIAAETKRSLQFTEFLPVMGLWFRNTLYPSAEGVTIFMKDITGLKMAEEELDRTRINLESLINNTEDLVWSIGINGCYIYTNQAYKNAVFRGAGVIPHNGQEAVVYGPDATRRLWTEYYRRALSGESFSIVYENTHSVPGQVFYYDVSFNCIANQAGEIMGTGCFARDITARLQAENEIIAQNERLRNIASLSSHELRRPVASMLGLINVIDFEDFANPDNKEAIDLLLVVGNEIDEVIRAIVDSTFTGSLSGVYKEE
ncbi:PAS domain-containing protein [Mucilaginibacter psychrotolerans]|uniref:histidine kinase n=1 Tax=Mucilaginibacter psychrotolerans TaxID=1524096 RepID=A0A4Y8SMI5_9SPHI|nr:PAS domain S-box protein [Mucilaginibacter psychrotolerans]TFF40112.1 PAS domain S-box protein [Mucilaginibacter psychrotolerans]